MKDLSWAIVRLRCGLAIAVGFDEAERVAVKPAAAASLKSQDRRRVQAVLVLIGRLRYLRFKGAGDEAMRFLGALMGLGLAGCAWSDTTPLTAGNQPDVAKIAAEANAVAKDVKLPEPLEVSPAREGHPLSPGPWVVCLRSAAADHRERYAIFFRGEDRVGYRLAVVIDGCAAETYALLPK